MCRYCPGESSRTTTTRARPTRRAPALEQGLGELEDGRAVAFSSGLAAEHALITVVCEAGPDSSCPADLYGGTYRLVDKVLTRWGLEYDLVAKPTWMRSRGRSTHRLIWIESSD